MSDFEIDFDDEDEEFGKHPSKTNDVDKSDLRLPLGARTTRHMPKPNWQDE